MLLAMDYKVTCVVVLLPRGKQVLLGAGDVPLSYLDISTKPDSWEDTKELESGCVNLN